jgi:hypothetical protein
VAAHHRILMATVVGIIITLAISSGGSVLLRTMGGREGSLQGGLNLMDVCASIGCEAVAAQGRSRAGGTEAMDFSAQREASEKIGQTEACAQEVVKELLRERATAQGYCSNKKVSRISGIRMWAEVFPEASCAVGLLIWLFTYPLLYINLQWLQRCVYYLIIMSEILGVCSLLVRPILIY